MANKRHLNTVVEKFLKVTNLLKMELPKYIGLEHIESGFPKLIGIGIESDIRSSKTQFLC